MQQSEEKQLWEMFKVIKQNKNINLFNINEVCAKYAINRVDYKYVLEHYYYFKNKYDD